MGPDDSAARRANLPDVAREELDVFREILLGNPTPEEQAQGKQLGIVGMLARGQRERKLMLVLLAVVSGNSLVDLIGRFGPILKGIRGLLP